MLMKGSEPTTRYHKSHPFKFSRSGYRLGLNEMTGLEPEGDWPHLES